MTKVIWKDWLVKINDVSFFYFICILIKVPNPDKQYLLHFDVGILDYRLNGKPNPDSTFETPN